MVFEIVHHGHGREYGYKFLLRLSEFVLTLNSIRNCSIDLMPQKDKNFNFFPVLDSKPLRGPCSEWETKIAYPTTRYTSETHTSQIYTENRRPSETVVKKFSSYTKKNKQDEIMRDKLYQKELMKVI